MPTNVQLDAISAEQRVEWSFKNLPAQHVMSTSFGAQAAVMLHLVTSVDPDIPVIFVDTGYLFPETYRFADQLIERLKLNVSVYRAAETTAWQEARHGQRWLQGKEGLAAYNQQVKVEPMQRALRELHAATWFSGLRRSQSSSRQDVAILSRSGEYTKVHAIADWGDRDVHRYLKKHKLPYHPLWEHGYLSIGDYHTTRSIHEVSNENQLRFFGVQRECGINDVDLMASNA